MRVGIGRLERKVPFRCNVTTHQPPDRLTKSQGLEVCRTNGFVADTADILGASAEVHANLLGRVQGDDLADVMEKRSNHQLIPSSWSHE